ncbi:hypothetical protein C1N80_00810 [Brachybacterium sp. SGAir0954]|uniref:substrate-binding periplasmic protein n=1 Tax=Brachybacterium sp. SGAir0954 TaxID=2571029 RepID=UPI0010CD05E6|nr:transporter substrate-binding domain-containing protein [Brachybacterium sp. SGAir0954]QCR52263.1 hypothetical protein C1N80_00810 [Brachybacterium sp. SGAir0954]
MIKTPVSRRRGLPWAVPVLACLVVIALALVFAVVRTNPPERSQPLQISTSEWLPYISPDLPDSGPVAQLLTEVFGRAGYTPEFVYSNWPTAEKEVTSGATIGMAPVVVSESRASFALYSDPLLEFRYTLIGKKGEALDSLSHRSDLTGVKVARIAGYQYWEQLEDSGATFTDYPSSLAAFTALKDGEVDVVAEGSVAGQAVLESAEFADDASLYGEVQPASDLTSSTQGLHLLMKDTPEGRETQQEFNAALAELRGTADYEELVASLEDTSQQVILTGASGGAVDLFDDKGAAVGSTPSGTTGSVLGWPEGSPDRETLVEVKILDGPYRGRLLSARLDDMEIDHA